MESTKLRYSEHNNIRILGRLFELAEKQLNEEGKISESLNSAISFELDKDKDPSEVAEFWEFVENSKIYEIICNQ